MKKQLLFINLGLVLATTSVASSPLFPKFILDKQKQPVVVVKKLIKSHEGYANFSGNWVGTCDNNPDETETMTIEQSSDPSTLLIDNTPFQIDAIMDNGFHENYGTQHMTVHSHWSKDGQQLLSTILNYSKIGNLSQEGLEIIVAKSILSLENEQLVNTYISSVFNDGAFIGNRDYRCVYTKQTALTK